MRAPTHRANTTPTIQQLARDITRGVIEDLYGARPQTHRSNP